MPWHNYEKPRDVDDDDSISPDDVLTVINYLNAFGSTAVLPDAEVGEPFGFVDVNGDNHVAQFIDALLIINAINSFPPASPEGESATDLAADNDDSQARSPAYDLTVDNLIGLLAADIGRSPRQRRGTLV